MLKLEYLLTDEAFSVCVPRNKWTLTIVVWLPLHPQKFPIYHFTNDCELVPMLSTTLQAQAMMKKHKLIQIWARCRFGIYLPWILKLMVLDWVDGLDEVVRGF